MSLTYAELCLTNLFNWINDLIFSPCINRPGRDYNSRPALVGCADVGSASIATDAPPTSALTST